MPRKKTTKKITASKKKLENLSQTHGKEENGVQPTTLDQIWGDTGLWKYKTMDSEEYTDYLKNLNKSDLQAHATKMGLVPVDNRDTLTQRLVREFKKHVSAYTTPTHKDPTADGKVSEEVRKILREGK